MGDGSLVTPMVLVQLIFFIIFEVGRWISDETYGLGDVLPLDYLSFVPEAQWMLTYILRIMGAHKFPWNGLFLKDMYLQECGIAIAMCRLLRLMCIQWVCRCSSERHLCTTNVCIVSASVCSALAMIWSLQSHISNAYYDLLSMIHLLVNFLYVWTLLFLITIIFTFHHNAYDCYRGICVYCYFASTTNLSFLKLYNLGSAIVNLSACVCQWILDLICLHRSPLSQICIINYDILLRDSRLCNWLCLQCFVPWINHLPPVMVHFF